MNEPKLKTESDKRLCARVEGRKDALVLLDLCKEAEQRLTPIMGQYEAPQAFWEEIRDYV